LKGRSSRVAVHRGKREVNDGHEVGGARKLESDIRHTGSAASTSPAKTSNFAHTIAFEKLRENQEHHDNSTDGPRCFQTNQTTSTPTTIIMADRGGAAPRGGGFQARAGDRGAGGDRGRGRGGRRGPRRGGAKSDEKEWQPVTKLGRLVKAGKIKSMEEIYLHSLPIKEYQIVDFFLPKLKDEVMKVRQSRHSTWILDKC
jgi:hypothetical protein